MPTFHYKVQGEDGQVKDGTVEAPTRFEVYNIVRKEGGSVLSVEEAGGSLPSFSELSQKFGTVSSSEMIIFTRNLGAMIRAGLSLSRALEVMQRQTKNPKLAGVLQDLQDQIQKGGELNVAMEKHHKTFSPLTVAMVRAGEESGTLADACTLISEQLQRAYDLKKKVRGAMIYPSIILTVLLGVGVLMLMYIVPTLTETFESMEVDLPASTQLIITLSDILKNYTLLALLGAVLLVVSFVLFIRTKRGKHLFEVVLLHLPVIGGLVKETNAARTGRTLASLLSSGVNVLPAFEITEDVLQNTHYKRVLADARAEVQKGAPIASIFERESKLYPPLVGELIAVGEETGNLPDMLREIALFYESEVDQKTKNMSQIIEPFMMVFVGGAVGYFAVAMISPIYSVATNF